MHPQQNLLVPRKRVYSPNLRSVPPQGIDVTLEVRGEGSLPLNVIAYRDGLPKVPELTPLPDNLTMIAKSYHV
jgi:hypothetical protein